MNRARRSIARLALAYIDVDALGRQPATGVMQPVTHCYERSSPRSEHPRTYDPVVRIGVLVGTLSPAANR